MVILIKYGLYHEIEKRKMSFAEKGDTVVLMQNGIFWTINDEFKKHVKDGTKVVALKEDYLARGYSEKCAPVLLISYDEFIEILEKDRKVIG
jgi:tRNA 2-thiouridine synthesizing protein B